jgi:CheY-like chemotaxis protein
VLVVDAAAGCETEATGDPVAALALLASWRPDVLLLGPSLSGRDQTRLLRQGRALTGAAIPAIALQDVTTRRVGRRPSRVAVVTLSVTSQQLLATIE